MLELDGYKTSKISRCIHHPDFCKWYIEHTKMLENMNLIPTFEENQIGDITVGVGFQVFGSNEVTDIAGCTTFIQRSTRESVKKNLPQSINNVSITPIKNSENKTTTVNFKLIIDFHSEDQDWDLLTSKEQAIIVGFTAAVSKAFCLEKMDELETDYKLEHGKWLEDNN